MRKNVRKYARVEGTEHLVDNFQYAAKPRTSPSERVANQSENRQPPPLPISERQALASKNEIYGKDIHEDLQGTRLAYHLKQLANQFRNTQHHDLSVMAEKALSGDFGANGRKSDVFQDIGKKLKSIKHEMGDAYNWHKIVPALAVDGAIRKAITNFARVKNPENDGYKFRLIAKLFGHQGYEKDESGKKMVGLTSNSEKSQKAWNIFRAAAAEAAKNLRLNKSHITDEMINRSLQRLAMKEEYAEADRTRVTKQLPQAKVEKTHPATGEKSQVLEPRGKQFTWHDAMGILPTKVGENSNPEQYQRRNLNVRGRRPILYAASHEEVAKSHDLGAMLNALDEHKDNEVSGRRTEQHIEHKNIDPSHYGAIADHLEEQGLAGVAHVIRHGAYNGDWAFRSSSRHSEYDPELPSTEQIRTSNGHPNRFPIVMTHVENGTKHHIGVHINHNGRNHVFLVSPKSTDSHMELPTHKIIELIESLKNDGIPHAYGEDDSVDASLEDLKWLADRQKRKQESRKLSRRKGNLNVRGVE